VRGAYAHISFPSAGSCVILVDVPSDWTVYRKVAFWARHAGGPGAAFSLGVGDAENQFTFQAALSESKWTRVNLPLDLFERMGRPSWDRVRYIILSSADRDPLELDIDELRLVERSA